MPAVSVMPRAPISSVMQPLRDHPSFYAEARDQRPGRLGRIAGVHPGGEPRDATVARSHLISAARTD